jgi:hypothetical protein
MRRAWVVPILIWWTSAAARADDTPVPLVPLATTTTATTEDEITDLAAAGEIAPQSLAALIELIAHPVDLATASREDLHALPGLTRADVERILAFRAGAARSDLAALVAAGVLSAYQAQRLAPFVAAGPGRGAWARQATLVTAGDEVPGLALQARGESGGAAAGAAAVLTRRRIGPAHAAQDGTLVATAAAPAVHAPKLFLAWRSGSFRAIAGSYRAGFGERLTFDDTPRPTPDGFYPDDLLLLAEADDFRWAEGLFGAAASFRPAPLEVHAWLSAAARGVGQYELGDRARGGEAPPLATPDGEPLRYQTIPDAWRELLAGARLALRDGRTHAGVTAWGASPSFGIEGMDLDFRDGARWPAGGRYGAVGADAAWGRGWLDLGAEVARSLDSASGGGLGAIARATASFPRRELELTLRWYDPGFDDPYAGAVSEPDETGGQRARDEAGARLSFRSEAEPRAGLGLGFRALADAWFLPSRGERRGLGYARGDVLLGDSLALSAWARAEDATHRRLATALAVRLAPGRGLALGIEAERVVSDDPSDPEHTAVWLTATLAPRPAWRIHARSRLRIDVGAASLWSYLAASWRPRDGALALLVRGDVDAEPGAVALWMRLELEARF